MNFESIHNYYEPLVIEQVLQLAGDNPEFDDEEFLQDVACVALNALPARYVRHDVDMAFFLTSEERERIARDVGQAVHAAYDRVSHHRREKQERGFR